MAEKMEEFVTDSDVHTYTRGDIITGKVLQIGEQAISVDIGYKTEGILRPSELAPFRNGKIEEGEELEVLVTYIDEEEGTVYVSEKQALFERVISQLEEAYQKGLPVKGRVEAEVPGAGYHVNLSGLRAFLPGSHLGPDLPGDINKLRGREVDLLIIELDRWEKNLVVSHKRYLEKLEEERKERLFASLEVGQVREGVVKSVVDFGIFVDIGGFEGLVHRSEITWKDIPFPAHNYKPGQKIQVRVIGFDREKERISLSIKRLRPNPWEGLAARYPVGKRVKGKVVSITDFGAFVELEQDVEGLVHISELSWGFPEDPRQVVSLGQEVEVVVLGVDEKSHRISLSLKRAQPDPWETIDKKYPQGAIVHGRVTKLAEFGAFVELEEGVEALLHISEMSWERIKRPEEVLKVGDEIEAKVLKSDRTKRKIRLSLKELKEDPWHKFLEEYSLNSIVRGKIIEIKDFGAFMQITPDVTGLIHVSEISDERISTPHEVLHVGDEVEARIIGINEEKRQVRLSMRNLEPVELYKEGQGHEALTMREHLRSKGGLA
jgi:small subunit ribosomal protein S1